MGALVFQGDQVRRMAGSFVSPRDFTMAPRLQGWAGWGNLIETRNPVTTLNAFFTKLSFA